MELVGEGRGGGWNVSRGTLSTAEAGIDSHVPRETLEEAYGAASLSHAKPTEDFPQNLVVDYLARELAHRVDGVAQILNRQFRG